MHRIYVHQLASGLLATARQGEKHRGRAEERPLQLQHGAASEGGQEGLVEADALLWELAAEGLCVSSPGKLSFIAGIFFHNKLINYWKNPQYDSTNIWENVFNVNYVLYIYDMEHNGGLGSMRFSVTLNFNIISNYM